MITFSAEEFYSLGKSRQGQVLLAVGVGGGCLEFFSLLYCFCSLHLSPGDGSIKADILPQRTVKPKTTNQHSTVGINVHLGIGICIFV